MLILLELVKKTSAPAKSITANNVITKPHVKSAVGVMFPPGSTGVGPGVGGTGCGGSGCGGSGGYGGSGGTGPGGTGPGGTGPGGSGCSLYL